jgi:short-chain fatty acids transporter
MSSENTAAREGFIARFIDAFARWAFRWVPDSMVFVLALTIIVYLAGLGLTDHGPVQLVDDWVKGFWVLLTFAMQMALLMITGFAVADSKPVKRGLSALVDIPKTRTQVVLMYAFFISVLWYLHWGVGMMAGIIMGREIAVKKRGLGIHYPFVAAMTYCTAVISNGPSMAAQLMVATPGHFMEKEIGLIPLGQTTFDSKLLIMNAVIFLTVPFVILMIAPKKERAVEIDDATAASFAPPVEPPADKKTMPPAERWDRSIILPLVIGLGGVFWIVKFFVTKGVTGLDLNTLNFLFLILGLLLHGSAKSFVASVQRGTSTVYGVIIQFPLYAGIFGMIQNSGLAHVLANFFISISNRHTYTWIVYLYSGVLDFFVPSGGSKFVIEAPYILPAAKELGVSVADTINAYTYGSVWINMVQPFWALPILGAFKLKFQDILPYSLITALWMFLIVSAGLLLLPLIF